MSCIPPDDQRINAPPILGFNSLKWPHRRVDFKTVVFGTRTRRLERQIWVSVNWPMSIHKTRQITVHLGDKLTKNWNKNGVQNAICIEIWRGDTYIPLKLIIYVSWVWRIIKPALGRSSRKIFSVWLQKNEGGFVYYRPKSKSSQVLEPLNTKVRSLFWMFW